MSEIINEIADLLKRDLILSTDEKKTIYKAFSSVSYSNSIIEFLHDNTGEIPIFSSGNPNSNVIILFHNKKIFIKWFNQIRDQIMEKGADQAQLYATSLIKTDNFGKCIIDDFIFCCFNECKIVNPLTVFLAYQTPEELAELNIVGNQLKAHNASIELMDLFLSDQLNKIPEAVIETIIDEIEREVY